MLSLSFLFAIISFIIALFAYNLYTYALVFLFFGISIDGFSIAGMNLVIEIAPEEKRPTYTALQTTITSFGLFFPIVGGILLRYVSSYSLIYVITIVFLSIGYVLSKKFDKR
jgi:MFS family permease